MSSEIQATATGHPRRRLQRDNGLLWSDRGHILPLAAIIQNRFQRTPGGHPEVAALYGRKRRFRNSLIHKALSVQCIGHSPRTLSLRATESGRQAKQSR